MREARPAARGQTRLFDGAGPLWKNRPRQPAQAGILPLS